jgi:hypothetical protein
MLRIRPLALPLVIAYFVFAHFSQGLDRTAKSKPMDRKQQLFDVVEVLVNVVRNIRLRRELQKACANPPLNFWRVIYGDLTDIAVLEWCKLFGSDDSEKQTVHWKNVIAEKDAFRQDLFSRLNVSTKQWKAYWDDVKKYRDRSVAHHDQRRVEIAAYPKFDLALLSAYFYYEAVVAELMKIGSEQLPRDLEEYADDFAEQCGDIAAAAMKATETFQEKVR